MRFLTDRLTGQRLQGLDRCRPGDHVEYCVVAPTGLYVEGEGVVDIVACFETEREAEQYIVLHSALYAPADDTDVAS